MVSFKTYGKALLATLLLALPVSAKTIEAESVIVLDADTVALETETKITKFRLVDIDAPELKQPYGIEAARFLKSFLAGRTLTIETRKKDAYGRVLAILSADGLGAREALVGAGYAWVSCSCKDARLISLEEWARGQRNGLWKDNDPIEPWNYRHLSKMKTCKRQSKETTTSSPKEMPLPI